MSQLIEKVVKEHAKPKSVGIDIDKFKESVKGAFAFETSAAEEAAHVELASKYQPIDLEFLKMRDKQKWPSFAIFTLNDTKCFFSGTYYHEDRRRYKDIDVSMGLLFKTEGKLSNLATNPRGLSNKVKSQFLGKYFLDVFYKLTMLGYKEKGRTKKVVHTISQTFGSALPPKTRQAINDAIQNGDFARDEIMIVCESSGWEVDKNVEMRPKVVVDPLVIGFSVESGRGYIIDVFDLSPMEDYVKREFGLSESESVAE